MSLKKRAIQSTALAISLVMMSAVAEAAPAEAVMEVTAEAVSTETTKTDLDTIGAAGVAVSFDQFQSDAWRAMEIASVTQMRVDIVAAGEESEEESAGQEAEAAEVMSEEEQLWQNRLLPDVNEYLNVRAEADENTAVIGKLYRGDVAEIVEIGDDWTHIVSGNVDGYVKNEYCVMGQEALSYAKENLDTKAEVLADGLRIRSEASEDASIITVVSQGTALTVDQDAEASADWTAVIYGGTTRYVSTEYVSTSIDLGTGITIEEEQAELQRLAEEKAAREAAQVTEVTTIQNAAVAASADEVTLLAAIIQCEAGNECYEGQVAVGAVVMNRVRSASYPSTIYDVIYQPSQFPPAGKGNVANVIANGPKDTCIQAAQEALNGTDNTGGATKFKRASSGHAGVVIGNHVFY